MGSQRSPAAAAKACIRSNVKTRISRGCFFARGSLARIRRPRNGLTSVISSVIASSVISRERPQYPYNAGSCASLHPEQMVDQRERVTATEVSQRPISQLAALDVYLQHPTDAVLVGVISAF